MMNLKLSVLITLALFALTVLSQQDPKAAQVGTTNTASPAPPAAPKPKPTFQECTKRCRNNRKYLSCMGRCTSGQ
ncbi:predicted protein [Lichtheimia corymbifera JMRC:FSU:9682]|uniref:Uncharacterized protein n=1 Tax=Lichtheimia corymbifera JMRC:FSU:9682 TaxID=1263082 RepID=A0A068RYI0_9FUNG|nr:predicted protein [Lichtheimia corymbifera JMRC:FSU:9682]